MPACPAEGRLVFLAENQGVCEWAVSDPSDPQAEVALKRDAPDGPWWREEAPVGRWAIQLLVFEAGIGAANSARALAASMPVADTVTGELAELGGAWGWPGDETRFFVGAT